MHFTDPILAAIAVAVAILAAGGFIAAAISKLAAAIRRLAAAAEASNTITESARAKDVKRVVDHVLRDADHATAQRVDGLRRQVYSTIGEMTGQAGQTPRTDETATMQYPDLRRATGISRLEASYTGVVARGKVVGIGYVGEDADPVKRPVPFREEVGSDDPRAIASDEEMSRKLAVFFDRQIEANLPPDYKGPVPHFWEPWPHDPRISGYQAIMDWYYAKFGFQFIPDIEMQVPWLLGDLAYIQWKERALPPTDYPQP